MVEVSSSFIRKGRNHRRVGQIRSKEIYLQPDLLMHRGGTPYLLKPGTYIVPSPQVVVNAMSVLDEICNAYSITKEQVMFIESVVRYAGDRGGNVVNKGKLRNLLFDSIGCVTVFNEQCISLFSTPRQSRPPSSKHIIIESAVNHVMRLVAGCCLYLMVNSTSISLTVLLLNENDPMVSFCQELGIPTIMVSSYISKQVSKGVLRSNILPELQELLTQFTSLIPSKVPIQMTYEYKMHLSDDEIKQALKSNDCYAGVLSTYKHSNFEGEIEVSVAQGGYINTLFLISGRVNMNRAMNGDKVVIRVLPREQWKHCNSNTLLDSSFVEEDEVDIGLDNPDTVAVNSIPYVEVIGIVNRKIEEIIATLPESLQKSGHVVQATEREEYILVAPLDRRLPKIRIRTRNRRILENQRFTVIIDNWPRDSKFPNGHFLRIMGARNDWRVEVQCLLLEQNVTPKPFSIAALGCLPRVTLPPTTKRSSLAGAVLKQDWQDSNYELSIAAMKGRRDFRNSRFVFSVDPPGCQDIDDAMSLEWIGPGMVEIAVHIADVCAFVEEGSALDLEARERATTIYLTHERYDMLPSLISSDIASLHSDKDRFTVSVLWNVKVQSKEDGGRVVNEMDDLLALDDKNDLVFIIPDTPTWVGRAMIHSVAAATYSQAHNLIYDLPPCAGEAFVPHGQAGRPIDQSKRERLKTDIRGLTAFSRFLNRKRETAGALDLSQGAGAELKFKIDVEGNPVEVQGKEELEIHHTISELMIAANSAVASIIYAATPLQTLLRIHPPPSNEKLKRLQEEILETGIDVFQRNNSSSELRKELRSYREHISKQSGSVLVATTDAVDLITSVVISSMNEAKYVSSSILSGELLIQNMSDAAAEARYLGHFGLGLKYYTHFTSPIRRYADIIVHRQLLRILQVQQPDLHENIHVDSQSNTSSTPIIHTECASNEDDDDFLDSLLEGVGDELLPTNPSQSLILQSGEIPTSSEPLTPSVAESSHSVLPLTPYSSAELQHMADHLNVMNRRAKACQFSCQKLFLCLYFSKRTERHTALVYALKDNGFMAFIPCFNYKGPVYLVNKIANPADKPTFECVVRREGDVIAELTVTRVSPPRSSWLLIPMQRVLVEVSCDGSKALRELRLDFLGLVSGAQTASTSTPNFNAILETVMSQTDSIKPEGRASEVSLYHRSAFVDLLNLGMKRKIVSPIDEYPVNTRRLDVYNRYPAPDYIRSMESSKPRVKENNAFKFAKQTASLRYPIKGSGRLSFGTSDQVRPIFKTDSQHTQASHESRQLSEQEALAASLTAGHSGARIRMAALGEDWAEEEDLPSESYPPSVSTGNDSTLSSKYHKELAMSQQRITKLKVAKRNSKYDS